MIPAPRTNARGVTEAALHFIGERDRGDQFFARRAGTFRDCERSRNVVARMRRLFRKIGVAVIKIPNESAIRERGPVRRRLMVGADDCRSIPRRKFRRNLARDSARLFVPSTDRATERIDHSPFYFVNDLLRKTFETK